MTLLDRVRPDRRPPAAAPYGDPAVRRLVDNAEPWRPVIGVHADGTPAVLELAGGQPHAHVTAPTGQGTSTLLRAVGAQALRDGARLVVLDFEGRSHPWASGLVGVEYHADIDGIAAALLRLDAEVAARGEDDAAEPRVVVLVERVAALARHLNEAWGSEGAGRAPAVVALADMFLVGRSAGIRLVVGGAIAAPTFTLGVDVIGCVTPVVSPWRTRRAWSRVTDDPPTSPADRTIGRWHVVADRVVGPAFHGVYLTDEEARVVAAGREAAG